MSQPASQSHTSLTLMFVDVCDSTRLYEQLGDRVAQQKINGLLQALREHAEQHAGREIKEIGDESLLVFEDARDALSVARAIAGLQTEHGLDCKTGIHTGEVICLQGDVFGDAVNTAARIVALATPGQVLLSQQTLAQLPDPDAPLNRPLPPMPVRGKSQALELVELAEDRQADYTQVLDEQQLASLRVELAPQLQLKWPGGELQLNPCDGGLTIGRGEGNAVRIPLPAVSRVHLKLEPQGHHWLVRDQSTNGTRLQEQGAAPLLLRREQHRLAEGGTLLLTPTDPGKTAATIHYRLVHA